MKVEAGTADARWWVLGATMLVLGLLIRVALYFPPAAFPIDSDGVLAGLCAFRIEEGQFPLFFPGGSRLSAASCYLADAFFRSIGPGRVGLALTGLTWAALYLIFTLLFFRAALGAKNACLAFAFAAVPSAAFVTVTYIPWAYGEIMASSAATLWLAALWRNEGRPWQRLGFGFSLGFGLWISLQTLMLAIPALAWIVVKRRAKVRGEALAALAGAVVGSAPLLVGNLWTGFPSFTQNWVVRPVTDPMQVAANLGWLLQSPLPQLLFHGFSGWWSLSSLITAGCALLTVGFVLALRDDSHFARPASGARDVGMLLLFVSIVSTLLYVFSQAGSTRAWTVRYIAPLYVVLPLLFGIGTHALWQRSRWLAIVATSLLLVPNLLLYSLPGSAARSVLEDDLRTDAHLRQRLARAKVRMVYGDYFAVYHLNFDAHGSLVAIPSRPELDYLGYGEALPAKGVRWALLGYYPADVARLSRAVGASGTLAYVDGLVLFVSDAPAASTAALLSSLRRENN